MIKRLPVYNSLLFALALSLMVFHDYLPVSRDNALLAVLATGAFINLIVILEKALRRADIEDIAIIYVYGFTDDSGALNSERLRSFNDAYVRALPNYSKEIVITLDNYVWDSAEVRLMGVKLEGRWKLLQYGQSKEHWSQAKDNALREGKKLYLSKIKKFEKRGLPYYIIGYSLGTRIVLEAMNQSRDELKMLRGVFFLGSALPVESTVTSNALRKGQRIVSYYSKKDSTLGKYFRATESVEAGGHAGFLDEGTFLNLETFYDHSEYCELINPLCDIILYEEGSHTLIGQYRTCQPSESGSGWNSLYTFAGRRAEDGQLLIQYRNSRYRALRMDAKPVCVAESDNLHLLLKNLLG